MLQTCVYGQILECQHQADAEAVPKLLGLPKELYHARDTDQCGTDPLWQLSSQDSLFPVDKQYIICKINKLQVTLTYLSKNVWLNYKYKS